MTVALLIVFIAGQLKPPVLLGLIYPHHFDGGNRHVHLQMVEAAVDIVVYIAVPIAGFKLNGIGIGVFYFYKFGLGIVVESLGRAHVAKIDGYNGIKRWLGETEVAAVVVNHIFCAIQLHGAPSAELSVFGFAISGSDKASVLEGKFVVGIVAALHPKYFSIRGTFDDIALDAIGEAVLRNGHLADAIAKQVDIEAEHAGLGRLQAKRE